MALGQCSQLVPAGNARAALPPELHSAQINWKEDTLTKRGYKLSGNDGSYPSYLKLVHVIIFLSHRCCSLRNLSLSSISNPAAVLLSSPSPSFQEQWAGENHSKFLQV